MGLGRNRIEPMHLGVMAYWETQKQHWKLLCHNNDPLKCSFKYDIYSIPVQCKHTNTHFEIRPLSGETASQVIHVYNQIKAGVPHHRVW